MQNEETIYGEIRKFVSDLVDSGAEVAVEWITGQFLSSRSDITGRDQDLYRYCTRAHVGRLVRRVVGKYDIEARTVQDSQIVLDGFEHLQRAYTVDRQSKVVLVPVYKMTDDELLTRADEYDKMADGCRRHAREIRGYVASRSSAEAA